MKEELYMEQHLRPIPSLPSPLHNDMHEITTTLAIPSVETFPSWAKQLLQDWGEVSEEEAMLRGARAKNKSHHFHLR